MNIINNLVIIITIIIYIIAIIIYILFHLYSTSSITQPKTYLVRCTGHSERT